MYLIIANLVARINNVSNILDKIAKAFGKAPVSKNKGGVIFPKSSDLADIRLAYDERRLSPNFTWASHTDPGCYKLENKFGDYIIMHPRIGYPEKFDYIWDTGTVRVPFGPLNLSDMLGVMAAIDAFRNRGLEITQVASKATDYTYNEVGTCYRTTAIEDRTKSAISSSGIEITGLFLLGNKQYSSYQEILKSEFYADSIASLDYYAKSNSVLLALKARADKLSAYLSKNGFEVFKTRSSPFLASGVEGNSIVVSVDNSPVVISVEEDLSKSSIRANENVSADKLLNLIKHVSDFYNIPNKLDEKPSGIETSAIDDSEVSLS